MAFIKLLPPEDGDALPVADVIRRLQDEFEVVDVDSDEGQDHVAGMIAAILRFDDSLPGKQECLARLLEAGANLNAHGERVIGNTPLSDNAGECTYEMAKLLIGSGADPTLRGWMQINALDRARQRKDANAHQIIRLLEDAATR